MCACVVQLVWLFQAWRWCIFFACFVPIYWATRLIIYLLVVLVEAKLFTQTKVIYFMTGVKVLLAASIECRQRVCLQQT